MTDELNRLREELQSNHPRVVARAKGMNAAMQAFENEFSETAAEKTTEAPESLEKPTLVSAPKSGAARKNKKSSTDSQGSDAHRRLSGQNAPRGGARPRRRSMTSRIPTIGMMFGGTAVAAALAAFVVVPNIKSELQPSYQNVAAALDDSRQRMASDPRQLKPSGGVVALDQTLPAAPQVQALAEAESSPVDTFAAKPSPPLAQTYSRVSDGLIQPSVIPSPSIAAKRLRADDVRTQSYQTQGRDKFESVEDNPVKRSADEPVSTFSVDVDTASYSFMRASVNRGQLPNSASVRVEELINYFPYQYEAPANPQEPFKANVTVTPTPWNAETKLMHIGIKGYTPPADERPNSNIVLLIDTSGSMNNPNKLPLLINSFKLLLDTLGENDTVSIVTYAGSAGTVLEPTPANERSKIVAAFDRLRAGGSTAGAAGLELAYNKVQENFDEDGVNRVILATDGDFNVGFSSPDEMKTFVEKKRESGVFLSVLGFGMGNYNDHLMQTLAQNGNGVAAYIDSLSEARKVLADEAGGALIPIAKDVKIQVEFNPAQISEYRLIGYETRALKREDFNNDKIDAGEIGSGHTVTAIYELTPKGSPAELVDELRYAEAESVSETTADASDEYAFVKIRYKLPNEDVSTLISRPVGALDETESLETASTETRFAASVAAFGQMLRGGTRLESYNYDNLIALANGAKGDDPFGYRAEFINLVRLVKSLDSQR